MLLETLYTYRPTCSFCQTASYMVPHIEFLMILICRPNLSVFLYLFEYSYSVYNLLYCNCYVVSFQALTVVFL